MTPLIDSRPNLSSLLSLLRALSSPRAKLLGMRLYVPGSLPIRLSVMLGNLRMQRLLDTMLHAGDRVIDVGANIGYNALYAARCVGPTGHVVALEPAQDNLAVLYANVFANHIDNVTVLPFAAGASRDVLRFYLRGDASAVNSLYADNFYHPVTSVAEVMTIPLDDLLSSRLMGNGPVRNVSDIRPNLIKIDVEGAELAVLAGMPRLLQAKDLRLIVEWHPVLQHAAGYATTALPQFLAKHGYQLHAVSHTWSSPLQPSDFTSLAAKLSRKRSPVELVAYR